MVSKDAHILLSNTKSRTAYKQLAATNRALKLFQRLQLTWAVMVHRAADWA